MKAHNGMRPQDIVILLKILLAEKESWQYRDLSASLLISVSEIAESLNRSHLAGLIDVTKKKVHRLSIMEFIKYGLHYVFPQRPGAIVTGIATAHSHPFYQTHFESEIDYVWEHENGDLRGQAIQPLYKGLAAAALQDEQLYKMLAGIDIIRVGKAREKKFAIAELEKAIL
ncbi:hypothetical protein [Dyadobacter sp. CY347]|uniref:hypothetical protein n=1 Tax=Dyadobacter sp. CY347 TaxID=2909336 RepID=UPI001F47CB7B|nr:hypothetical protein [Dyadobacter sp. CY347]MCF2486670.1 hypothetical protein [Dyadobacter sp. CY347]